jgi:hypothetical protein
MGGILNKLICKKTSEFSIITKIYLKENQRFIFGENNDKKAGEFF